jgi:hypothetical protein
MSIYGGQAAIGEQFLNDILVEGAQSRLVNHVQAVQAELLAILHLGQRIGLAQQAEFVKPPPQLLGSRRRLMKFAQELDRMLELRRRLAIGKQGLAVGGAETGRRLVDANQQFALGASRGNEGIAPHEGRNVARIPLSGAIDEQIFAFPQSEQHGWQGAALSAGKDDRIFAGAFEHFATQHRDRIAARGIGETARRPDLQLGVNLIAERDHPFVKHHLGHEQAPCSEISRLAQAFVSPDSAGSAVTAERSRRV